MVTTAATSDFVVGEPRRFVSPAPVVAGLGLLAAAGTLGFALASESPDAIQVFLLEWLSVPYIVAGLIAWWRRPDSRLGLLMIAGGFVSAFSGWQFAADDRPYTLGVAFDLLPAAVFLHVFLAFPGGRLRSRLERVLVGGAYAAAIGLQVVKLTLGGVDPKNLLDVAPWPGVVARV